MGEEPITCRYQYTVTEFKRAVRCFYWHSTLIWCLAACLVPIAVVAVLQDAGVIMNDKPLTTWDIANNFASLAFFIVLMAGLFVFMNSWSFRRMPSYNQNMEYTLSPEGVRVKTALFETTVFWEAVARATESKWGIVLLLKGQRAFHWLPKCGFVGSSAMDSCRALLRQHVPDTKNSSDKHG